MFFLSFIKTIASHFLKLLQMVNNKKKSYKNFLFFLFNFIIVIVVPVVVVSKKKTESSTAAAVTTNTSIELQLIALESELSFESWHRQHHVKAQGAPFKTMSMLMVNICSFATKYPTIY